MIAPQNDNRVVGQIESVEFVEQLTDQCVGVADASVVAADQVPCRLVRDRSFRWDSGVGSQFA